MDLFYDGHEYAIYKNEKWVALDKVTGEHIQIGEGWESEDRIAKRVELGVVQMRIENHLIHRTDHGRKSEDPPRQSEPGIS